MERLNRKKKGAAVVYLAILMTVLLLFSALVIDIGMLALNKSDLQNACDAAALAGAQELPDIVKAESVARQYAIDNGIEAGYIHVEFPAGYSNAKITVTALNKPVDFFFAKIIGINQGLVSARASAIKAPVSSGISGLRPFGLYQTDFHMGQTYTMKESPPDGVLGNFQWLDLPNPDAHGNTLDDNIREGSPETYSVGDSISSEPGVSAAFLNDVQWLYDSCPHTPKCTSTSYQEDCPRLITVPIIGPAVVKDSGKTEYPIVGFAKFFLDFVGKASGKTEVTGTFIEEVTVGGVDPTKPDFKLNAVKLVD